MRAWKVTDKKVKETARWTDTTPEAVVAALESGELTTCPDCGYPVGPNDVDDNGRCEGCAEDYNSPSYSEPFCTLG